MVPSPEAYNQDVHLNLDDMALDSHSSPAVVCLWIKQSKTDPFWQGADAYLGCTDSTVCLCRHSSTTLASAPPSLGPHPQLGGPRSSDRVWSPISKLHSGQDNSKNNGHGFRIGTAMTAAQQCLEDLLFQTLGQWHSDAYKIYIKLPGAQLANVSQELASCTIATQVADRICCILRPVRNRISSCHECMKRSGGEGRRVRERGASWVPSFCGGELAMLAGCPMLLLHPFT